MKKVKVLDYHFHSDSSRNLTQSIQPMQSVLSPCLLVVTIGRPKS
jgi:hypothetical protein